MRQSQQKNRMRGRGRKMPNPMSRNYESNGPDVKIRGNAAHVAEKYTTLARDAFSSGDTVMGENYLQHAEHYNRIVAAAAQAQAQQFRNDEQPSPGFGNPGGGRGTQPDLGGYSDEDDGGETFQGGETEQGGEDNAPAFAGNEQHAAGGQAQRGHSGNGQAEQGSRHHRNRRRPRYGENGRDEGYRERQPRDFDSAPGRANGSQGRDGAEPVNESQPGISSDASRLPQSILGGPAETPSTEHGSDE